MVEEDEGKCWLPPLLWGISPLCELILMRFWYNALGLCRSFHPMTTVAHGLRSEYLEPRVSSRDGCCCRAGADILHTIP